MKKLLLYGLILLAACMLPVTKTDISNLEPISCVAMERQGDTLTLYTDTRDQGQGRTVAQAIEEMKKSSEGVVYLDTARYLLVEESAQGDIPALCAYLKGGVRVARWQGSIGLSQAAQYMQSHKLGVRLDRWDPRQELPVLEIKNGKMEISD